MRGAVAPVKFGFEVFVRRADGRAERFGVVQIKHGNGAPKILQDLRVLARL